MKKSKAMYKLGQKEYNCHELQQIDWNKQGRLFTYMQMYTRIKRLGVDEAVNGYRKKKKCLCGCGMEFTPKSSKDHRKFYGKGRCRRQFLKNQIIRGELKPSQENICEMCGAKFPIYKCIGMPGNQRFCCDDCRSEHHAIMMRKNPGEAANAYGSSESRWEGLDDKPRDCNLARI